MVSNFKFLLILLFLLIFNFSKLIASDIGFISETPWWDIIWAGIAEGELFFPGTGKIYHNGRISFYLKGKFGEKLEFLSTYDTGRARDNYFLDLSPFQSYPTTGDTSTYKIEGESRSPLFLKLSYKDNSFLFGSFRGKIGGEFSSCFQTLSGTKITLKNKKIGFSLFVAQREGTLSSLWIQGSGLREFKLVSQGLILGSENLLVQKRDRDFPELLMSETTLTKNKDYVLSPLGDRFFLKEPLLSEERDAEPLFAYFTYQTRGDKHWVYGGEVSLPFSRYGNTRFNYYEDKGERLKLGGLGFNAKITSSLALKGEGAYSWHKGKNGGAWNASLNWKHKGFGGQIFFQEIEDEFFNPFVPLPVKGTRVFGGELKGARKGSHWKFISAYTHREEILTTNTKDRGNIKIIKEIGGKSYWETEYKYKSYSSNYPGLIHRITLTHISKYENKWNLEKQIGYGWGKKRGLWTAVSVVKEGKDKDWFGFKASLWQKRFFTNFTIGYPLYKGKDKMISAVYNIGESWDSERSENLVGLNSHWEFKKGFVLRSSVMQFVPVGRTTFNRSYSFGLEWLERSNIKASGGLEFWDGNSEKKYFYYTSLEMELLLGVSFFTDFYYDENKKENKLEDFFHYYQLGMAWRGKRMQILTDFRRFHTKEDEPVSFYSLDMAYRLNKRWEFSGKFTHRNNASLTGLKISYNFSPEFSVYNDFQFYNLTKDYWNYVFALSYTLTPQMIIEIGYTQRESWQIEETKLLSLRGPYIRLVRKY